MRVLVPLILLTSWPFVAFLANNSDQRFSHADVLVPWAGWTTIVVIATFLATLAIKGRPLTRVALVAGGLSVVFFSFGAIADLLIKAGIQLGTVWLAVWAVIFVIAGWLFWIGSKHPSARLVASAIAIALLSLPTIKLASTWVGTDDQVSAAQSSGETPVPRTTQRPNVYWFLLDGYVRADNLARYFNHDNEPFLRFLRDRNFRIAQSSNSNYDNTTFSLSSTLRMDYMFLPNEDRPQSRVYTGLLAGYNPTVNRFLSLGYRYMHAPYAGAAKTQCGGQEHRCIHAKPTGRIQLNDVQLGLLQLTPAFRVLRKALKGAFRFDHIFIEDVLDALRNDSTPPFFLFAHILSPHSPPRYTPDCGRLDELGAAIDVGEGVYDQDQFRTDVVCTNRSMTQAVNEILENDPTDPIIIIQGDHGFKFRLLSEPDGPRPPTTQGSEPNRRLAILNAMRLPANCRSRFYDEISPVNTFRLVLACIEDTAPDLVADRHFVRPRDSGDRVFEVNPDGSP